MSCKSRITVVYILLISMLAFVILRLFIVSSADTASQVLSGQYSRKLTVAERHGFIFDRNGKLLNSIKDGNICVVNPLICTDMKDVSERISSVSRYSQSEIYDKMLETAPFLVRTDGDISAEGVYSYPYYRAETVCAPHIVGYTDSSGKGVTGVERFFANTLTQRFSGKVSYRYTADAVGIPFEKSGSCLYDSGYTENSGIYLTLDMDLQLLCESLAKEYIESGAICIGDVESGEMLALVSYPDFDTKNVGIYLDSEKGELVNRCTSAFTPGSVFKTAVAAAALESDQTLYELEYECKGYYETEDGDIIPCHKAEGHGLVTMKEAYAHSCNPYFINLALLTGEDKITETAKKMGLTENGSLDGIFPYSDYLPAYSENISSKSGYIANLAIGQGRILVTPISMCSMFSCAVTGYYSEPSVLVRISDGGKTIRDYSVTREESKVLSEATTEKLSQMMKLCVEEGLGKEANPTGGNAAGKTATAQSGVIKDGKEVLNCWFCGVYPADNPEYTICVLSCSSRNGNNAKTVYRKICEYVSEHTNQ